MVQTHLLSCKFPDPSAPASLIAMALPASAWLEGGSTRVRIPRVLKTFWLKQCDSEWIKLVPCDWTRSQPAAENRGQSA